VMAMAIGLAARAEIAEKQLLAVSC
jgi:hypothetical protein